MDRDWNDIDELIVRRFSSVLEPNEQECLEAWIQESTENAKYFEDMQKIWQGSEDIAAFDAIDVELDYKKFANKVGFQKHSINTVSQSLLSLRKIAAIMIPFMAISVAIVLYQTTPGFGKWVAFSSSTEMIENELPDNSTVAINANSKLVFQKSFKGQERLLKLKGEAYFKVAKNPSKPFVVNVGDAQVKVLGTEFNLEENEKTGDVLLLVTEGKVLFSTTNNELELVKGESAICIDGVISRKNNISSNIMAWRTGEINFTKAPLAEVMETILDYFPEVEAIENNTNISETTMTSKFESPSLEDVMVELRIHFDKKFSLDGNKLIISD
ncbi:FecR family protein [Carboxylicivirga sp. N1Y90]|uniref:FecR family protein n=1 Tax=Carboxylicivirga fragile TaxID=3417571 RepID=UPI003D326BFD|nr:FecR domain-containing protein [Marinilabiliaceae bacterium N1Y90]